MLVHLHRSQEHFIHTDIQLQLATRCTRPQPHGQPHDLCVLWLSVLEGLPPGAACERHSEHLQLEVVAARGGLVEEAQPHVAARFTGGAALDGGGGLSLIHI